MTERVLPGCEPFVHAGGATGVLLVHGFSGSPFALREWGADLARRGFAVDCPRLPGHGTSWHDFEKSTAAEWAAEADEGLTRLRSACSDVVVAALSFGGTIALDLASRRPDEVRGLALVNPWVRDRRLMLQPLAKLVLRTVPGTGNDIKKPGGDENAYARIPVRSIGEASRMMRSVQRRLPSITTPIVVFHSTEDHVIPRNNGPYVISTIGSTDKELVTLPDSYHVATLDNDAPTIFERSAAFFERVTAAEPASG